MTAPMPETIVAAALLIEGVTISLPQPARHGHVFACLASLGDINTGLATQGFLTSTGRFVNRAQARQIAHIAGQNPKQTGLEHELYSEDLW